jgi:hypothetical protein
MAGCITIGGGAVVGNSGIGGWVGDTHGRHSYVVTVLALLGSLDAGKLHIIHRN